ncbi:Serine/arginine-rich splicing factor SC35 [Vitis vinifera]|uniref:Serine/arginine-rich splicing factor SC35 n=1 Tax=Vitis vinifera TaxID=29760 RepID=A0A438H3A8_VITVI|nr:Serine/arginine-rich splicing factor SC35 [Vitis vinifera]
MIEEIARFEIPWFSVIVVCCGLLLLIFGGWRLSSSSSLFFDLRTGESRGFAFVRYKYADEAQKAVDRLDGRIVDGREITVQFAKYGPNAERIHKGRIVETFPKSRGRSRSHSPRRRQGVNRTLLGQWHWRFDVETGRVDAGLMFMYRDDNRDRDYRRRNRSRSYDRYESDRYRGRERDYRRRSRSHSASPDYRRGRYDDGRRNLSRSRSIDSVSPTRYTPSPKRNFPPRVTPSPPRGGSQDRRSGEERSPSRSISPRGRPAGSRSPSLHKSDADVRLIVVKGGSVREKADGHVDDDDDDDGDGDDAVWVVVAVMVLKGRYSEGVFLPVAVDANEAFATLVAGISGIDGGCLPNSGGEIPPYALESDSWLHFIFPAQMKLDCFELVWNSLLAKQTK